MHFTCLTNGTSCPFTIRQGLTGLRRWYRWLQSHLHWFLWSSANITTPLQWYRVITSWEHNIPCDLLHVYTCHQQRWQYGHLGFWEYQWYTNCTGWGTGRNLVVLLRRRRFAFNRISDCLGWKKGAKLDNLYNKPSCRVLPKAFSISKYTVVIDGGILLLKCEVTCPISLIHWIVVLWRNDTQTDFHVADSFLLCALWQFLEYISRSLSKENFGTVLVPFRILVRLSFLFPTKVTENVESESSG